MKEKICIIGGGNIGTALVARLSKQPDYQVVIHTSKQNLWTGQIQVEDLQTGELSLSEGIQVTDCIKNAVEGAKIVFITHPSFLIQETLHNITPFLQNNAWIGVVPGTGGAEFYARSLIKSGYVFFGLDRVPCIARVKEIGRSVASSFKEQIRIAAIPEKYTQLICEKLSFLLDMKCIGLKNYLTVTLTPSNPILHTARLYSLFATQDISTKFQTHILFYKEWTDQASELLMNCDCELQMICKELGELDLEVVPLTIHYESKTVKAMTQKLSSITTLRNIKAPMKHIDGGYIADLDSRYFVEDIPYGLCILKGIAVLCGLSTPNMDLILKWYEKIRNIQYYCGDDFTGEDLKYTAVPQNFGLMTKDELIRFYNI